MLWPPSQVYSSEQSTVIAGLEALEGGDYFAMPSVGEAEVDLEGLRELDQAMAAAALADSDDDDGAAAGAMDEAEAPPAASAPVRCGGITRRLLLGFLSLGEMRTLKRHHGGGSRSH